MKKAEITDMGPLPPEKRSVQIPAPNFEYVTFHVGGPLLVIHRFSAKAKAEIRAKMEAGSTATTKRKREPVNFRKLYEEARYRHASGWDGFQASAVRASMVSACRTINFKMTLAKLAIFCVEDGWDATEPQIALVRIHGEPVLQEDICRVATGEPYVAVRPAYHDWSADVKIRFDADLFTVTDITNLMMRVGQQVGWGEGRPDSKKTTGMPGWGTFEIEETKKEKAA